VPVYGPSSEEDQEQGDGVVWIRNRAALAHDKLTVVRLGVVYYPGMSTVY
jgi:hypothetical protein